MWQNRNEIFIQPNIETQKYSVPLIRVFATRDQAGLVFNAMELNLYTGVTFSPGFPCRIMRQFPG
jgi:hypothetical protein